MGYRRSNLQEAIQVPGDHGFRIWGYGTTDPLADLLSPGYFRAAGGLLHPGQLIIVGTEPRRDARGAEHGEKRTALLMVSSVERGDGPAVRLVQDFGGPDDATTAPAPTTAAPASPPPPPKRGRGRPPGSRTKPKA